jgi:FkbM family methyltransferase
MTVSVRHGTPDMAMFTRVFWRRMYDPPEALRVRLAQPLNVLDLGANIGLFAASLGRNASVTAVEADVKNAALLEEMVAANGLPWRVIRGFASTHEGTIRFAGGQYCLSRADPSGDLVDTVDVFPLFHGVDLLKMDIEGAEWEILDDPRMADAPPILVMEWHPERCPGADPRQAACDRLQAAGYTQLVAPDTSAEGESGHLWAWR